MDEVTGSIPVGSTADFNFKTMMSNDIAQLTAELRRRDDDYRQKNTALEAAEEKMRQLKTEISTKQSELKTEEQKAARLKTDVLTLKGQIESDKMKLEELQRELVRMGVGKK